MRRRAARITQAEIERVIRAAIAMGLAGASEIRIDATDIPNGLAVLRHLPV